MGTKAQVKEGPIREPKKIDKTSKEILELRELINIALVEAFNEALLAQKIVKSTPPTQLGFRTFHHDFRMEYYPALKGQTHHSKKRMVQLSSFSMMQRMVQRKIQGLLTEKLVPQKTLKFFSTHSKSLGNLLSNRLPWAATAFWGILTDLEYKKIKSMRMKQNLEKNNGNRSHSPRTSESKAERKKKELKEDEVMENKHERKLVPLVMPLNETREKKETLFNLKT